MGDREKSEVVEGDPDRAKVVVEGDPDCAKVVEGAGYNGKRPESVRNQRYVETSALHRVRGPGGHSDEEVESGDIGGEQERRSNGDGVEMDGIGCQMDGATSGARCNSKRVET